MLPDNPTFPAAASDGADMPKPGDFLIFGSFEQDNDLSNGPEPISWRVLSVEGEKALIISDKCLDARPYHTESEAVTWETSTLRAWLNGDFLMATFTSEEQEAVLTAAVNNENDPSREAGGGRDTNDKVFLLNVSEANSLFPGEDDRMARITRYAQARYAYDNNGYGFWWLRTMGESSPSYAQAASVDADGIVGDLGVSVDSVNVAVRPALYVNLDYEAFSSPKLMENGPVQTLPAAEPEGGLNAGNVMEFGRIEQDNNLSNGPEPISWRVLALEGRKALVISENCLDARPYNTELDAVIWELSTLRAWLNGEFITTAFTPQEQEAILTASVKNEDNPYFGTDGGGETSDKVFLLSIDEAISLFKDNDDRMAGSTAYALAQGAYEKDGHGFWWLRSPGYFEENAACVSAVGSVSSDGYDVDDGSTAVRPALWIDLNSAKL